MRRIAKPLLFHSRSIPFLYPYYSLRRTLTSRSFSPTSLVIVKPLINPNNYLSNHKPRGVAFPNISSSRLCGVQISNRNFSNDPSFANWDLDDLNDSWSDISTLDYYLKDAALYKHVEYRDKDVSRCTGSLEVVLAGFNEARRRVPAGDERILYLEPKIRQMEAQVKMFLDEIHVREICDIVLALVLRFLKGGAQQEGTSENDDEDDDGDLITGKATIHRYKNISSDLSYVFEDYLMKNLLDNDDTSLLRWMDFQIQLLKVDAKDLDTYYNEDYPEDYHKDPEEFLRTSVQGFLNISNLLSHFDEVDEDRKKLAKKNEIPKVDCEEKSVHDKLVFSTIVKIAKAREKMSLTFAAKWENHLSHKKQNQVTYEKHLSCVPDMIKEASDCFDDLLGKLPVDYCMTLRQWLDLMLWPRIKEYI